VAAAATAVASLKRFEALEAEARGHGAPKIVLNARYNAVEFYRKRGYGIIGDGETLFGVIRHVRIEKLLQ
jgi:hypothetical protein